MQFTRDSSLDAGGFTEENGDCVGALLGRSLADRVTATGYASESGSIRQLSLQSKFLPSFWERYSPPNPESASIGRNLGWRNTNITELT